MLVNGAKKIILNVLPFLFLQFLLLVGGIVLLITIPKREFHNSSAFLAGLFMISFGTIWLIFSLILLPKAIFVRHPKPPLVKTPISVVKRGEAPALDDFAK